MEEFKQRFSFQVSAGDDANASLASPIYEIGRGAAGTVYFDPAQPDVVYKVPNKDNKARSRDLKKEKELYEIINNSNIDEPLVKMVKMTDFSLDEDGCCLQLTRAVNPIDWAADYTIQPMFGAAEFDYRDKHRGLFLGFPQSAESVEKYGAMFSASSDLRTYMEQLGRVMAKLHYEVKNDGFDIELFLSRRDGGDDHSQIIIYIGDFDLSEQIITEYSESIIERMVWCFAAVPYFPSSGELFAAFSQSYIYVAELVGSEAMAIDVMARFAKMCDASDVPLTHYNASVV